MKQFLLLLYITLCFPQNTIVDIFSTYYDGTPKEVIIYEYSYLYTDNPFKIIEKLSFDRNGNIIFDYDNYFNGNWRIAYEIEYKSSNTHQIQIDNNQIKYLKPSESCLDCHYAYSWNMIFLDKNLFIETNDILNISSNENIIRYNMEILSSTQFVITDYQNNKYYFKKLDI